MIFGYSNCIWRCSFGTHRGAEGLNSSNCFERWARQPGLMSAHHCVVLSLEAIARGKPRLKLNWPNILRCLTVATMHSFEETWLYLLLFLNTEMALIMNRTAFTLHCPHHCVARSSAAMVMTYPWNIPVSAPEELFCYFRCAHTQMRFCKQASVYVAINVDPSQRTLDVTITSL